MLVDKLLLVESYRLKAMQLKNQQHYYREVFIALSIKQCGSQIIMSTEVMLSTAIPYMR